MRSPSAHRVAILFACAALGSQGQVAPLDQGPAATDLAVRRIGVPQRILYITAHPDDEDAALLTYLARGRAIRTALLTLSRGEGGANLAGSEMGSALGALRTEELLLAGKYYGVEQYFTRAVDFGFSKRLDETLEHWPKDLILRDAVQVVRLFKPDIIIGRFHGTARDGHGNHMAAGVIAREVWDAAADKNLYPDAGPAWSAKKLYRSVRPNETATLRIDTAVYDPLIGTTLRELAIEGYRQHRTQAMAGSSFLLRGGPVSSLELIANRLGPLSPETDILNGFDPKKQTLDYNPKEPWKLAMQLAGREDVPDDVINRLLGVRIEAVIEGERHSVAPGETLIAIVKTSYFAGPGKRDPVGMRLLLPPSWQAAEQSPGKFHIAVPPDASPTRHEPAVQSYLPFSPPLCMVEYRYRFQDRIFRATQPLQVQVIDKLYGPQRQNLTVRPAVSVTLTPRVGLIPKGKVQFPVHVELAAATRSEGTVSLKLPHGWTATPLKQPFQLGSAGDKQSISFILKIPKNATSGTIQAIAEANGHNFTEGYRVAGYRGLESHAIYEPAQTTLKIADVRVAPNLRIGYIAGAGDDLPASLMQLDIKTESLSPEMLATSDLAPYTAIIVGVRASAVRPDFKAHRDRLLKYVQNGGHLIVQYQTQEFDEAPYGPWPYRVKASAEEVSEEAATVAILEPGNPVFQTPNPISSADFEGWVEERGSKFLTEWDPRYTPLLESHDREQAPQKGGLIQTRYGKGYWTYAAYSFYRQLPAGVPGAYRLFANLLSLTASK
ncbi:MAG: PIG-L family deacetylase [Bryobacteraceae bacterium]|nr:PIG-L family deacetylase [Bryobacteraceae bacterium]